MKHDVNLNTWNPEAYLEFAAYRARPAGDLISRISLKVPGPIYDLGCGPGNLTVELKDRWSERDVVGLDSSPEMLADAEKTHGTHSIRWEQGDIATWAAPEPAALVFANASLQWVDAHERLFPRLLTNVRRNGILAVQMPMTADAPYQISLRDVIASSKWREKLTDIHPHADEYSAARYYEILRSQVTHIDMWESRYHHILDGTDPVVAWMSGAGLTLVLSRLNDEDTASFLADYTAALRPHYPRQKDGRTIFTMRRLFIVAVRA